MTSHPIIASRLNEILDIYKAASTVYNSLGNGSLKKLPLSVSSQIDRAVSKALLVSILLSLFTEEEIKSLNITTVIDDLLTLVLDEADTAQVTQV